MTENRTSPRPKMAGMAELLVAAEPVIVPFGEPINVVGGRLIEAGALRDTSVYDDSPRHSFTDIGIIDVLRISATQRGA
jgi:hypothetical protein